MPITRDEKAIAHALDAAWIIGLYQAIHGGDPAQPISDASALIASGLVSLLAERHEVAPAQIIANLAKLNVKVTIRNGDKAKEIRPGDDIVSSFGSASTSPFNRVCVQFGEYEFCHVVYRTNA